MKNKELVERKCIPCQKGTPPLTKEELIGLSPSVDPSWKIIDQHHLEREFIFPDFKQALDFTVKIGAIAEAEGHHPDITVSWGKVKVVIWTHKINGLSLNDFILAAKIDQEKP